MLLFYVLFCTKGTDIRTNFRKEGDVFLTFQDAFLGNTTSCDVEFQSD